MREMISASTESWTDFQCWPMKNDQKWSLFQAVSQNSLYGHVVVAVFIFHFFQICHWQSFSIDAKILLSLFEEQRETVLHALCSGKN